MNRRELFQQLAGVAVVNGMSISDLSVISADSVPVIVIFEAPGAISDETAHRLKDYYETTMKDTAFADVKIMVLGDGLRATFFDGEGNVCNQRMNAYLDALETTKSRESAENLIQLDTWSAKYRG